MTKRYLGGVMLPVDEGAGEGIYVSSNDFDTLEEKFKEAGRLYLELQARLDTTMGLLRELEAGSGTSPGANKRWSKVRKFLNTTSTEGKGS